MYTVNLIYSGSTDDVRIALRHCVDTIKISELQQELKAEKNDGNRVTVIQMLQAAINKKVARLRRNYPKQDKDRYLYVRYPVKKGAYWYAAIVTLPGYRIPEHITTPYKTERGCQKACDANNSFHGYTEDEIKEIISASMDEGLNKKRFQQLLNL